MTLKFRRFDSGLAMLTDANSHEMVSYSQSDTFLKIRRFKISPGSR